LKKEFGQAFIAEPLKINIFIIGEKKSKYSDFNTYLTKINLKLSFL